MRQGRQKCFKWRTCNCVYLIICVPCEREREREREKRKKDTERETYRETKFTEAAHYTGNETKCEKKKRCE